MDLLSSANVLVPIDLANNEASEQNLSAIIDEIKSIKGDPSLLRQSMVQRRAIIVLANSILADISAMHLRQVPASDIFKNASALLANLKFERDSYTQGIRKQKLNLKLFRKKF